MLPSLLPTPLQPLPRLGAHAGLPQLFVKRDDLTGFAGGGTKVRKLAFDLVALKQGNIDTLLVAGGIQSNLVRIAAAAGAVNGMEVKAVLGGPSWTHFDGNLLLDLLFGAEIRHLPDNDDNDAMEAALSAWNDELTAAGKRTAMLPIGGSTSVGSLGCIELVHELADELGADAPVQIVLPVGSCGTFAGMLLGARIHLPQARIIGISVSRTADAIRRRTAELAETASSIVGHQGPYPLSSIECYDQYHEVYGEVTAGGKNAIELCARTEGLILDPVYTGKAMHGLLDLARTGVIDPSRPVVFLHTGGLPVLFAYERTFRDPSRVSTIQG